MTSFFYMYEYFWSLISCPGQSSGTCHAERKKGVFFFFGILSIWKRAWSFPGPYRNVAVGSISFVRLPHPQRRVCVVVTWWQGRYQMTWIKRYVSALYVGGEHFEFILWYRLLWPRIFVLFLLPLGYCKDNALKDFFIFNFLILKIFWHETCVIYQRELISKGHIFSVSNCLWEVFSRYAA